MKRRHALPILGLLFLASLTACGTTGTEIETYQDPNTGSCYVSIHKNKAAGKDYDDTYLIPCVIYTDTTTTEAP